MAQVIRPELDETALVMNANVHNCQHVFKETSSAIAEMENAEQSSLSHTSTLGDTIRT